MSDQQFKLFWGVALLFAVLLHTRYCEWDLTYDDDRRERVRQINGPPKWVDHRNRPYGEADFNLYFVKLYYSRSSAFWYGILIPIAIVAAGCYFGLGRWGKKARSSERCGS